MLRCALEPQRLVMAHNGFCSFNGRITSIGADVAATALHTATGVPHADVVEIIADETPRSQVAEDEFARVLFTLTRHPKFNATTFREFSEEHGGVVVDAGELPFVPMGWDHIDCEALAAELPSRLGLDPPKK